MVVDGCGKGSEICVVVDYEWLICCIFWFSLGIYNWVVGLFDWEIIEVDLVFGIFIRRLCGRDNGEFN